MGKFVKAVEQWFRLHRSSQLLTPCILILILE